MKKIILSLIATLLVLPLAATACAGGYESTPGMAPSPMPTTPAAPPKGEYDGNGSGEEMPSAPGLPTEPSDVPTQRIIVRNADMSLVVSDVIQARDQIEALAVSLNGWVVNSSIYDNEDTISGWISIRIPSQEFDRALTQLRALAVRVSSESTNSQDITEEYVDLQSRLGNAEATERQYLTLLNTATEVEDILSIYQALSQIRYEIEQIKGRLQYLDQISATSQITVNLVPEVNLRPVVPQDWSATETLNAALRGLSTFGQGLGTAFIWIGIFSPIWGTALGITLWRRRKRREQQA